MLPSWTRRWPPGTSEQAGGWVAQKLAGTGVAFQAAAVAQIAFICSPVGADEAVTLTVSVAEERVRITARPGVAEGSAATVWDQQAERLADRHGPADDPAGLWAELDLEGVTP